MQGDQGATGSLAARLLSEGMRRTHAFGAALPEPLASQFRALHGAWRERVEADGGLEARFLGPWGTPAFHLLASVAESAFPDRPLRPATLAAAESMCAWYFALRCQDDVVDEEAPRELVYLIQSLEARALRTAIEAAGRAEPVLELWEDLTARFAAAALEDARLRGDASAEWDAAAIALQGRKFLPMAGPPAALLVRAGRDADVPSLVEGVERLAVGLQLTNDLAGAGHDLATAQRSPFLAALDLRAGLHGEADIGPATRRAIRSGAYAAYTERALAALDASLGPLSRACGASMAEHVAERVVVLWDQQLAASMRALATATPLIADLEITRRCNLRCDVCFVREQEPSRSLKRALAMETELVLEVLEELSGYATIVHLTGGEPFLHAGIWEILERCAELGLDEVVFNTNCTLLCEANLQRLAGIGVRSRLMASLDGLPEAHDRARGCPGNAAQVLRVLRRAPELGVAAEPATVLTRELLELGLGTFYRWLEAELGVAPVLTLWPLFLQPGASMPSGSVGTPLGRDGLERAAAQVAELVLAGADVTVVDGPTINPLLARLGVPRDKLWQCNAARGRLCVQADGVISPCHPYRHELGRVERGQVGGFVARALHAPDAQRIAARDHRACEPCPDKSICGTCQAAVTGSLQEPFVGDDPTCPTTPITDRGHLPMIL